MMAAGRIKRDQAIQKAMNEVEAEGAGTKKDVNVRDVEEARPCRVNITVEPL
jgi:hypothetical protein